MSIPTTTVVPFASLPSCAANCGPLYDANGACVPPVAVEAPETVYEQCICAYGTLQGLLDDPPSDVCNGQCVSDPEGYISIRDWFTTLCNVAPVIETVDSTSPPTATGAIGGISGSSSSSSGSPSSTSGGDDWLSAHWKWVVMLILMFVGITAIWIGACIWRRRYLKKKDRLHERGKRNTARVSGGGPWVPGPAVNEQYGDGVNSIPPNNSEPANATANMSHPNAGRIPLPVQREKQVKKSKEKGKGKDKDKGKGRANKENEWTEERRSWE